MDAAAQKVISDFVAMGSQLSGEAEPQQQGNLLKAMQNAGIPKRYYGCSFEALS